MIIKPGKPSKKSKEVSYWTPIELFIFLTNKYKFYPNCDLAATAINSLCDYYYDAQIDALRVIKWHLPINTKLIGWLNAPNNKLGPFLRETYDQFHDYRTTTMGIFPSNIEGTKSWWYAVEDPIDRGEKIFTKPILGRPTFRLRGRRTLDKKGKELSSINSYKVVLWGRTQR